MPKKLSQLIYCLFYKTVCSTVNCEEQQYKKVNSITYKNVQACFCNAERVYGSNLLLTRENYVTLKKSVAYNIVVFLFKSIFKSILNLHNRHLSIKTRQPLNQSTQNLYQRSHGHSGTTEHNFQI